jgi:hypothetical protein
VPEIKLELFDPNQANELRRFVRAKIPQARVVEGVQDIAGGAYTPDRHITIDYHDEQLLDAILRQYFEPQGRNWRDLQTN